VNPALQIPESVRATNPNQIMFTLDSTLSQSLTYDYEGKTLSFYTTFGGNPFTVVIPMANIGALTDDDGLVITLGKLRESTPQPPAQTVPSLQGVGDAPTTPKPDLVPPSQTAKPLYTLKHLSLVVDNT